MPRSSDGGKGSDRRHENGDAYRRNHDGIDWSKKQEAPQPQPKQQARTQRFAFELCSADE